MIDTLLQIGIAVVGVTALLLVSLDRRAGWIVGLAGQPLWIAFALRARAWGIFALTLAYTVSWAIGVYRHYRRRACLQYLGLARRRDSLSEAIAADKGKVYRGADLAKAGSDIMCTITWPDGEVDVMPVRDGDPVDYLIDVDFRSTPDSPEEPPCDDA